MRALPAPEDLAEPLEDLPAALPEDLAAERPPEDLPALLEDLPAVLPEDLAAERPPVELRFAALLRLVVEPVVDLRVLRLPAAD